VEVYRGKPIFYGLGSFSFHTGHGGRKHGDWIGLMAEVELDGSVLTGASCRFVRHNDRNETVVCDPAKEADATAEVTAGSVAFGTRIQVNGETLAVDL
jgi:poly-gamma-glutamate capsule biosynthesis protein CapA/YwtB (metallophosphatase superfamily)